MTGLYNLPRLTKTSMSLIPKPRVNSYRTLGLYTKPFLKAIFIITRPWSTYPQNHEPIVCSFKSEQCDHSDQNNQNDERDCIIQIDQYDQSDLSAPFDQI